MQTFWVSIEAGVPYVDIEKPYGSRKIAADVERVLQRKLKSKEAETLHREALRRLPILLSAGRLSAGTYAVGSISAEQILLLQHLRTDIDADPEEKLPFNFKRPYGEMTAFELDMAPILGVEGDLSEAQTETLYTLHDSLEAALPVWLAEAELAPGAYQETDSGWVRVEVDPQRLVVRALTTPPKPKALIEAVDTKNLAKARELLETSADPTATDENGFTALGYAVKNHDLDAVRLLLSAGVDIDEPQGRSEVPPLLMAAAAGAIEIFEELLVLGAELKATTEAGTSALGLAVVYGRRELVAKIEATGWVEGTTLGIYSSPSLADEAAARKRLGLEAGAVVTDVTIGSTADTLGIQIDDCIIAIDHMPIADTKAAATVMKAKKYGDPIRVEIIRDGGYVTLQGKSGPRIRDYFPKFQGAKS